MIHSADHHATVIVTTSNELEKYGLLGLPNVFIIR